MNKLNLNPVLNESTLSLNVKPFKCFSFIDEDQVNSFVMLGFNGEVDDEVNNIYYVEYISKDLVTLEYLYSECMLLGIEFKVEYEDEIYDFDKVVSYFLS